MAELYWAERANIAQAKKAGDLFKKVLDEDPENYVALWKLSRVYFWIGRQESPRGEKEDQFEKGIELAEKAIGVKPDGAGAHFWLGVNSASLAEILGFWPWLLPRKLSLVGDFRHEMHTVIRLDPAFEAAGAYRALGVYYLEKPFPDPKEAEKMLEEAVRIAPIMLCNHFYLAQAYARQGKLDLARERRLHVLEAPVGPDYVPEDNRCKEDAQAWQIP
ncbi:MAG: tetratricopeptide repeat protein [Candidatus Methylomirabilales bacterium]